MFVFHEKVNDVKHNTNMLRSIDQSIVDRSILNSFPQCAITNVCEHNHV